MSTTKEMLAEALSKLEESLEKEMLVEALLKLEGSLECPVCYKIPRDVPIPCCEAGHIVCQDCRKRVTDCPTCRGRLESNTSSLAASQVMFVNHKCKFSFLGCNVKMKLEDIIHHEKVCPERTITCPYAHCKKEIQMKKFKEHAVESGCTEDAVSIFSWSTTRDMPNTSCDIVWKLQSVHDLDRTFYFEMGYLASKKSFIFVVFLPEDVEKASKYNIRLTISPGSPKNLIYQGPVLSIEDLPVKPMKRSEDYNKYWIVSYDVLKPFFRNDYGVSIEVKIF